MKKAPKKEEYIIIVKFRVKEVSGLAAEIHVADQLEGTDLTNYQINQENKL